MEIQNSQFWKDELQTDYPKAQQLLQDSSTPPVYLFNSGRVLSMLCEHYAVDPTTLPGHSLDDRLVSLLENREDDLLQMIALKYFQYRKRTVAIEMVARRVLSDEIINNCMSDAGKYDHFMLLLALYLDSPNHLKDVLLRDIQDRKGHAELVLTPFQEINPTAFRTWCTVINLNQAIGIQPDGGANELLTVNHITAVNDNVTILLIRDSKRDSLRIDGNIEFGNDPEAILLDFASDPNHLNISANRIHLAVETANQIIRYLTGQEKVEFIDAERMTSRESIDNFFVKMLTNADYPHLLREIRINNIGLPGEPSFKLTNQEPISEALSELISRLPYDPLDDKTCIDDIKILFADHRITLKFEWDRDEENCVVRYSDSRLTGDEKTRFKTYMKEDFRIDVLSTDKKGSR